MKTKGLFNKQKSLKTENKVSLNNRRNSCTSEFNKASTNTLTTCLENDKEYENIDESLVQEYKESPLPIKKYAPIQAKSGPLKSLFREATKTPKNEINGSPHLSFVPNTNTSMNSMRRKSLITSDEKTSQIRVVSRFRPFNQLEKVK